MFARFFSRPAAKAAGFRPAIECLEGRTVPAALNFVTTAKSGSTLTVTANNPGGENNNNQIEISGGETPGTISVWSSGGVRTQTTFSGITNIVVHLKDGQDCIGVHDLGISGNLTIDGGTGDKDIYLGSGGYQEGGLSVGGVTTINTFGGNDDLHMYNVQLGTLKASLGAGNDTVCAYDSYLSGLLVLDTGAGNDGVSLSYVFIASPGIPPLIPSVYINLGAGNDSFYGYSCTLGLALVNGGTGYDSQYGNIYSSLFTTFTNFEYYD